MERNESEILIYYDMSGENTAKLENFICFMLQEFQLTKISCENSQGRYWETIGERKYPLLRKTSKKRGKQIQSTPLSSSTKKYKFATN